MWVKLRHHFYKSHDGEYHVCGDSCDRVTRLNSKCPISNQHVGRSKCVPLTYERCKQTEIFSMVWNEIMNGRRNKLHKKVLRTLSKRSYEGSSFEVLLKVREEYHELTQSYFPFTWERVLKAPNRLLAQEIEKLAVVVDTLYKSKIVNLSHHKYELTVMHLVRIIVEGVRLRQNIVMFYRNYFLLSALPPSLVERSQLRTSLLRSLRTSAQWRDIHRISLAPYQSSSRASE
jgi:hypothetical protein